jgi:S1-C subfamily serine protease
MMANENFYNLIVLDKPLQKNLSEETKIYINYKKTDDFSKKFFKKKKVIEEMRKSVVTIFAGDGHGSGFLISEDGHILTNEHVVGGAHSVQVKFASGREVTGKVIRVNKLRDVALIKLERDIYPFLPISSSTKLDIGTEAYAIGTPLKENLSQTVTRGVISGFREEKGIRYIQSDVNIQPGNSGGPLVTINDGVCGICVSGISFGPISIGLNYFIPIEEAITSLNIVKE